MDFKLDEQKRLLKEMVRKFTENELKPRAGEWDEKEIPPRENIAKLAALGLMGLCIDPDYGGQGGDHFDYVLVLEEMARGCAATAGVFLIHTGVASKAIDHFGGEEMKRRFLPPLAKGERIAAFAMTEPGAGSAATDLSTRAVLKQEHYLLNGTKCFISNGNFADVFTTVVRLSERPGARGIGALVIEKGTPGFSVGKVEKKLGVRGFPLAELIFEDCRVPRRNLLLPEGSFSKIMGAFNGERCGNSAVCLGIAQAAFEEALAYSQQRRQFGRDICEFQGIQWMLADMKIKCEAGRFLVYRAALGGGNGFPRALEASIAKCFCNEMVIEVTNCALQIFGGYGYMREYNLERYYRDARAWAIAGGTTQMQRNIIASQILGRKFPQRR